MSTKTQICNLAINHLGTSKSIANVDTERSLEANTCRIFFDVARQAVLRDYPFSFATKTVTLGLLETFTTGFWNYSYRYPSDCLQIIRIRNGIRNETHQTRVAYEIEKDDSGKIILTDERNAEAEYTQDLENTSFFTVDFNLALSYRLAFYIAPALTKGDPFKIKGEMLDLYRLELSNAIANDMNERQDDVHPESEFVRSRNNASEEYGVK